MSSSTASEDYRAKWVEYSALDIPEYWIIDPLQSIVTICVLEQGRYRDSIYRSGHTLPDGNPECVMSFTFPTLNLTADQILRAVM